MYGNNKRLITVTVKLSLAYPSVNMRQFTIGIIILQTSLKISGLYTIVECPMELQKDIEKYSKPKPLQISCTMQLLCPPKDSTNHENCDRDYQMHENDPDVRTLCEMKLKINVMRSISTIKIEEKNPCSGFSYDEHPVLLPHSTNCSLFYKCNWGKPMLFRCPEGMHFNSDFQVCTWPWQGGCNSSRIVCPRPFPQCPIHYSDPLLLPHPFLCDRFYQCNWGMLRLQMCPTGLHFDPYLKVCNWPYNSNCQSC